MLILILFDYYMFIKLIYKCYDAINARELLPEWLC